MRQLWTDSVIWTTGLPSFVNECLAKLLSTRNSLINSFLPNRGISFSIGTLRYVVSLKNVTLCESGLN